MSNSQVAVTEGSGKNVATTSFTEDAVTKEIQRIALNDDTGTSVTDSTTHTVKANPLPLTRDIDQITNIPLGYTVVNLTASGRILAGPGIIAGFLVNTTSGGTVRISDALTATTPYLGAACAYAAGVFYPFPARVATGGYVTIETAAIDVTFFVLLD